MEHPPRKVILRKLEKTMRNPIPRVAAIHDLAGFARTSLTAAIPILSSMGRGVA